MVLDVVDCSAESSGNISGRGSSGTGVRECPNFRGMRVRDMFPSTRNGRALSNLGSPKHAPSIAANKLRYVDDDRTLVSAPVQSHRLLNLLHLLHSRPRRKGVEESVHRGLDQPSGLRVVFLDREMLSDRRAGWRQMHFASASQQNGLPGSLSQKV